MVEKMTTEEFNKKFEFSRKGRGLKAIPKGVNENDIKKHKFGAKQTERDGIKFPSLLEADVYSQTVKPLELSGAIKNVIITARSKEERKKGTYVFQTEPFCFSYVSDFEWDESDTGEHKVVDAKGVETDVYKKKRKLMREMFGIEIFEIRRKDLR